ncbi:NTP transferase domain-containing protein [Paenibacillus sp. OV219]|uniref:nucleotidyltransferase family protein n=1 Tax=Paenibacillus sp. OV219 TaxID=1884377 RepID=UPI0008D46D34|nr:nucleotidyltransferase family protein [Paenibacillus sp. OV219]SEO30901.1 molybdenum cofactor cytidylyltransferase [Paenibacillus sp. OV219]
MSIGSIGAIILAAGMSTRMGEFKPVIPLRGKPLLHFPIEVAAECGLGPIVVVGGYCIDELRSCAAPFKQLSIVENRDYASGIGSSLRLGIEAVTGRTDAVFIFLADQPLVSPVVVVAMLEQYRRMRSEGARILRPVYAGMPGHPVLFDAELYTEFATIQGDEGGKSIISGHRSELLLMRFDQTEWGIDVDTPQDLLDLKGFCK